MQRKTIQLAGKTLVLSLPNKWVKQWGIAKGDALEVTEQGSQLTISTKTKVPEKKTTADVRNAPERVVRWYLSGLHKQGFDEIEVLYEKPETLAVIQDVMKHLFLGMVITKQSQKRCVIRSVSSEDAEQFDQVLRRAFLVTLSMGDEMLNELKKSNFANLQNLTDLEKTNNQLTNFCQRILNRNSNMKADKITFLYTIIWNLEKICDDYKYICLDEAKRTKPFAKQTLALLERTNALLRVYYNLFYDFDAKRLHEAAEEKKKMLAEINTELLKSKDVLLLGHLKNLILKIADFSTSMFSYHQG